MTDLFAATDGQTPLDADEREGMIPAHITTRAQLNEWELANITAGIAHANRRLPDPAGLLNEGYLLRHLHRWLFGDTWRWAGTFRRSDKNIGIDWRQVPVQLHRTLQNFRYRLEKALPMLIASPPMYITSLCAFTSFRTAMAAGRAWRPTFSCTRSAAIRSAGARSI